MNDFRCHNIIRKEMKPEHQVSRLLQDVKAAVGRNGANMIKKGYLYKTIWPIWLPMAPVTPLKGRWNWQLNAKSTLKVQCVELGENMNICYFYKNGHYILTLVHETGNLKEIMCLCVLRCS